MNRKGQHTMKTKTARKTIGADPWARHTAAVVPPPAAPVATQRTRPARKRTAAAAPQIGAARAAAPAPAFAPPAGKVQLSLRFDPAALERARNACAATGKTFQGMIDAALARECERLEKAHGGKPFPPRAAALKTGPRPARRA
jgi:uncharacterized protein (DUF4415 family)